jgi:hypothetical protein
MGYGSTSVQELQQRAAIRSTLSQKQVTEANRAPELMSPYDMKVRECIASDTSPEPVPIAFYLDVSGSMGHVPNKLMREDLHKLFERLTTMGSVGNKNPQICMSGVADFDMNALQVGQFEADARMDEWLTRIQIDGGGGSAYMHEAYMLALYVLARKTRCDCWSKQKKGHVFITGDEMCNPILTCRQIKDVFGDDVPNDLDLESLLEEVRQKWFVSFLYVHTLCYGENEGRLIWKYWQELLGENAYRLDGEATGLPELVSSIIGINEGVFSAQQAPQDLIELGTDVNIVKAVAESLRVNAPTGSSDVGTKRRRPTRL